VHPDWRSIGLEDSADHSAIRQYVVVVIISPAPMKPSALRIERLLAKVEAELACSARACRYVFHYDEVAKAEAQGPYVLVPRVLSRREWMERYAGSPSTAAQASVKRNSLPSAVG
jgi:hypothetical protein